MIHTNDAAPRVSVIRDTVRVWTKILLIGGMLVGLWNWRQVRNVALTALSGENHLALAATSGQSADVQAALADGADPNRRGPDGFTPLMWAAASGDTRSMEALIRAGADLRAMSASGISPLIIAAQRGNLEAVRLLLDAGVEPTLQHDKAPTALYAAASFGHEPVVALLLRRHAPVNARCGQGRTALMVAAGQTISTREGIARLLNAGADPNARDDDGNSAKDEAASAGRDDLLEMFDAWQGKSSR